MFFTLPDKRKMFFEYALKDSRLPTLLFINGINQDSQVWKDFKLILSQSYNILLADLIFQGQSDKYGKAKTFEEHAQDLFGLIRHLGLLRVSVVGISYGGAVAQRLMVQYTEYIHKAVLFSTFAHKTPTFNEMNYRWQRTLELGNMMPPMIFGFGGSSEERNALLKLTKATSQAGDYRTMLKDLPIPCLIVHGEKDTLTPPSMGKAIADCLPNSRLVVIKDKAHILNEEAVPESVFLIKDFLG